MSAVSSISHITTWNWILNFVWIWVFGHEIRHNWRYGHSMDSCQLMSRWLMIRKAESRLLTTRCWEIQTPQDLMLKLSNRSEIWQVSRQLCCRKSCQMSEMSRNLVTSLVIPLITCDLPQGRCPQLTSFLEYRLYGRMYYASQQFLFVLTSHQTLY